MLLNLKKWGVRGFAQHFPNLVHGNLACLYSSQEQGLED